MSSGLFPQDRNILLGLADWAAGLSAELLSLLGHISHFQLQPYLKFKLKQQYGNSRSPGYMNFEFMIDTITGSLSIMTVQMST